MLLGITAFEIRYQLKNPVFWVAIAIFFLLGFGLTASENVSIGTPGSVHENAPFAIAMATALFTLFYLFVVTAFVANAIVRDDTSGFAPIVRATSVTRIQIVLGRFLGGLIIAWLGYLSVPLGMALGSAMPWVDPETVGPQKLAYYLWNYAVFALPNVLLTSALLFALATVLRSMMAAYIGAVLLVMGYLVAISLAGQKIEYREAFARFEPLGNGALRETTRYWTQADLNSRLVELSGTLLFNRLLAIALALGFLGFTVWRFTMTERAPSKRALRRLAKREARDAKAAAALPADDGRRVVGRDSRPSRWVQFATRVRVEARQVLTSPGLIVLSLFAIGQTAAGLWLGRSTYGTSDYPTLSATIDGVRAGFSGILLMIAVFYGGELVWRERDRKLNEILDSTPVPSWVMTVPKIIAIFLVLLIVNLAAMATGLSYQLIEGAPQLGIAQYVGWFIIPAAIDGLLIAVLAVVVQVLSPNKYVGWGVIFVWFVVAGTFLPNMGYSNPLYSYAQSPGVPLSDFVGVGSFWKGAAVLQFYWLCFAVILAVTAHLLWPRGTDLGLGVRIRRMRAHATAMPLAIAGIAALAMAGTGAYAYHNIKVLNRYQTADELEKFSADYERKYLKYERLPRPVMTKVTMDAKLFPKDRRLIVDGRYDLRNDSGAPIRDVHIRQGDQDVEYLKLDLAGARLVSNDKKFGYRIFRFDTPLAPGATTSLAFTSRIWRRGFRANRPETDIIENGTFANNFAFAPIIGMSRQQLLSDRTKRRRQGLAPELRPAKLEDLKATAGNYINSDWVKSDITFTTDAGQTPIAPGNRVSDVTKDGRRTAHFVSAAPILNFFSLQSSDYKIANRDHNGINLSVYYHQGHDWNVPKMLNAMGAALDYYRANFGPYQFDYARIIEFPGYASFAQAFAGTMPYSESIGFNADTSDPEKIDFTTYVVAHEMAHQYWAHQVVGADMQGGTLSSETLAQYSALMVMKKMYGPDKIRRFLKYELDGYLSNRKGEVVEELPLVRVENQGYIHYRKGAVVMYLLQERIGEDAVNRALARFVAKYRFKGAPYLRSTDLIDELHKEAKTPEHQQLITDLFERITLYDLKLTGASTRKDGDGWVTTLTVAADKSYADGKGAETKAKLEEPIEVGLFTARPGLGAFSAKDVVVMDREPLRGGAQKVTLRSKKKPTFAGVDPYNFYVDRNSDDNVRQVDAS
jgi:ABC-type transport system involved in multi-copper enzyme maturation permease subunit